MNKIELPALHKDMYYFGYGIDIEKPIEMANIIIELQQENKILKENAENNDKVVDKVNWENMLLKKENKQLQERIEYLERSNNRREDTILEQRQEISDLEDNWNKLKEIAKSQSGFKKRVDLKGGLWFEIDDLLDKIQELEQGSDSNE